MIEQGLRKSYFKPIPPDKELDKLDKNSVTYSRRQRRRRCCMCANTATQMLALELEGCKKIERYCDSCASALNQTGPTFQ